MDLFKKHSHLLSIGAAICAALSSALMTTLAKIEVEKGLPVALILFARACWSLIFLIPIMLFLRPKYKVVEKLKTARIKLHLARDILGLCSAFLFFFVLQKLSLTVAVLLYFTVPLFIPFVGYIWERHPLPRAGWIGLIIGFAGVVCVIKPGHELFQLFSLLGLLTGIIVSISQFATHLLTKTEPNIRINLYYFTFVVLITFPASFFPFDKGWAALTGIDFLYFFGIGVFGLSYVLFMTLALKYGSPPLVTTFLYTVVIFSMLLDWLVWKTVAHWLTWLGSALIILGVALKYYLHKRDKSI